MSFLLISFSIFIGCDQGDNHQRKIVEGQCGTCHMVPEPKGLTQQIWKESVLPQMSFYYQWDKVSVYPYANQSFYNKKAQIPMNDDTWRLIESYYISNSPVVLEIRKDDDYSVQHSFDEIVLRNICSYPSVTAVSINERGVIYCAAENRVYQVSNHFDQIDTLLTSRSIVSQIKVRDDSTLYLLNIGQLGPNDNPIGSLNILNRKTGKEKVLVDSLYRPVYMNQIDRERMILSEYGNNNGRLSTWGIVSDDLSVNINLPGAYKSFWLDLDQNGQQELLVQFSQAQEGIYVCTALDDPNNYVMERVLSFPPEFGFSDMDTADINHDGYIDLVISNGDNADYSNILKNYHGVRIYINDKKGHFEETYFHPIYGATQLRLVDADGDGDQDIVVASFFTQSASNSLLLLTNDSKADELFFAATKFANAHLGRWMVMDRADMDADGDEDIIVGSFISGPTSIDFEVVKQWKKESVDLLILKNKSQ